MKRNIVGQKLNRGIDLGKIVNEEERTIEVSISSEFPVARWDGDEILVHTEKAIDMSRFPLPLCVAHDTYRGANIGLIENPEIRDKKLYGVLRFGERTEAAEYWTDVKNGIIRNLSIGYVVQATEDQDKQTYRVSKWMPYEGSLVSVPADNTVGVGRSLESEIELISNRLDEIEPEKKDLIIRQLAELVDKHKPSTVPDESGGDIESDPMIRSTYRKKVQLKENQLKMEQ